MAGSSMTICSTRSLSFISLMGAALLMAGCSSIPFIGSDEEETIIEEAEEQSNRKAVLAIADDLLPDPRFFDVRLELPQQFANSTWEQPGGEPDHVMHHLSAPQEFSRAWASNIGKGGKRAPISTVPVVAENKVYTLDPEGRVSAFNVANGSRVWSEEIQPDLREPAKKFWERSRIDPATLGFGGGVAYDGGWLFMANGFARAAALNATSGDILWEAQLPAPVRNPPTAVNGKLFVVTMDNQIVALDQATGEEVWSYQSFEESARVISSGSPAVDGDVVIAPFSSGEVVALDSDTGRLLWTATIATSSRLNALSTLNDIAGSPVIDRGGVFAVSHAGQLAAIDARTGRSAWELNVSSRNTPWIAGELIYLISNDGDLLAISRGDGAVVWRKQLPAYENERRRKGPISWSGPILAGGNLLLVSTSGRLMLADPRDGDEVEVYKLSGGSIVPPIVADGSLYILTDEGRLEAWR